MRFEKSNAGFRFERKGSSRLLWRLRTSSASLSLSVGLLAEKPIRARLGFEKKAHRMN